MLRDQATELRNLVRRAGRTGPIGPGPTLVSIVGGQQGVGGTTVAVNLATALTDLGLRVVLADANLERPAIARHFQLPDNGSIADILAARRDIHEILAFRPGGLQILPGVNARNQLPNTSTNSLDRLLTQFRTLGRHVDALFADVGSSPGDLMGTLWRASDHVLLVTSPDDLSIMDTYAIVKTAGAGAHASLRVLVNRADDQQQAEQVFVRLSQSCRRFLGIELNFAGWLPPQNDCDQLVFPSLSLSQPAAVTPMGRAWEGLAIQWQSILDKRDVASTQTQVR